MLHHISLGVSSIKVSSVFYDAILQPLGYVRVFSDLREGEANQAAGYGLPGGGDKLCLKQPAASSSSTPIREQGDTRPSLLGFHLAFTALSQQAVDEFFRAAIENGGHDNGPPGFREEYELGYYAAFVVDPDGHHLEAVYKSPRGAVEFRGP